MATSTPKSIFMALVMTSTALAAAPLQASNTAGNVVTLAVGTSVVVDGLKLKLVSVRPFEPGDRTRGALTLEVGDSRREVVIGGYAWEARFVDGHLLTKLESSAKSASVRISRLALSVAGKPVVLGTPISAPPFTVTVNDFFHVNEYGAYFSASLEVQNGERARRSNTGEPFTIGSHRFEWEHDGFSRANLVVRPIRLGEDFELLPSQTVTLEGVQLTLTSEVEERGGAMTQRFTLTDARGTTFEGAIMQRYQVLVSEPPPGKHDEEQRVVQLEKSDLSVKLGPYRLENVRERKGDRAPHSFRLSSVP